MGLIKKSWGYILMLILALACTLYSNTLADVTAKSIDYTLIETVSNSMEPTILKGSMSLVQKCSFFDISNNDIVMFKVDTGVNVVHRVIDKKSNFLVTKGDSSSDIDSVKVTPTMIVGKVVYTANWAVGLIERARDPVKLEALKAAVRYFFMAVVLLNILGLIKENTVTSKKRR